MPGTEDFQWQTGLTLFLMSRSDGEARLPEEWFSMATLPDDSPRSHPHFRPECMFGQRVLRYLEWFGLMETVRAAANDDWINRSLYRKTPLFERFLTFHVGDVSG